MAKHKNAFPVRCWRGEEVFDFPSVEYASRVLKFCANTVLGQFKRGFEVAVLPKKKRVEDGKLIYEGGWTVEKLEENSVGCYAG